MGNNALARSTRPTLVRGASPQWSTQPMQQHFGTDDGGAGGTGDGGTDDSNSGDDGKGDDGKGGGKEFTPITSQADFDKAVQARIERAKKPFADYDQQKADAEKWRQAQQDAKPAEQRTAEEIEALRRENETLKSAQLRSDVAAAKGVPAALLSGATKEELESAADALIEFRGKTPAGPIVGNENAGTGSGTPNKSTDWLGDALRR